MKTFICLLGLCLLLAWPGMATAQTNPSEAACGLPTSGDITQPVTYTLSSNCTLNGALQISTAVTIEGGGYTIKSNNGREALFQVGSAAGSSLSLSDATIRANPSFPFRDAIIVEGSFAASNVTIRDNPHGTAIAVHSGATVTLNSVLLANNQLLSYENGAALHISANATATLHHAVIRNNGYGGGAVVIEDGGALTATGCLSFSGNVPYNIAGNWTDNSSGACSGTIGNGGAAVIAAPKVMDCGLPAPGNLDESATYIMTADCDLSPSGGSLFNSWRLSEHVTISINGNGHRFIGGRVGSGPPFFSGASSTAIVIPATATLDLYNVALESVNPVVYGTLTGVHTSIKNLRNRSVIVHGNAELRCVHFENNLSKLGGVGGNSLTVSYGYDDGTVTINDVAFINTRGGQRVMTVESGATVTLNGCLTTRDIFPRFVLGDITDNSTGECIAPVGPSTTGIFTCIGPSPTPTPTLEPPVTKKPPKKAKPTATPPPMPTATLVPPTPTLPPQCIHRISAGENLYRIALRYNMTVREISSFNHLLRDDRLAVGQELMIPFEDCLMYVPRKG